MKPTRFRLQIDPIEVHSERIAEWESHFSPTGKVSAIETLWHNICSKQAFDLEEKSVTGQGAFFAYAQTLTDDCAPTFSRDPRNYHDVPKSVWLANGVTYLTKTLGRSDKVAPAIWKAAPGGEYFKWSLAANGATNHPAFAQTANGYYVLAPKVLEEGIIEYILFGGGMPFVLCPWDVITCWLAIIIRMEL